MFDKTNNSQKVDSHSFSRGDTPLTDNEIALELTKAFLSHASASSDNFYNTEAVAKKFQEFKSAINPAGEKP